jgi:Ricin-type beta-trefoil lectin domain-like
MRNHRLAALAAAAAMATASALAVAPPAHAATANSFELESAYNYECLQPTDGSSGQGVLIVEASCDGSLAQQWAVASASSGFHLVNRSSGLCLDARGGAVSGVPVEQWSCDWISNEDWKFPGGQLSSGVSGTYTHCVTVTYEYPGMELGLCTDGSWQIWYHQLP